MRFLLRPISAIISYLGHLMAFAGLGTLMYQGFQWYTSGQWPSISLNDFLWELNWFIPGQFYDWLAQPTNISGINKISVYLLGAVPAAAFLLILGVLIAWVIAPLRR